MMDFSFNIVDVGMTLAGSIVAYFVYHFRKQQERIDNLRAQENAMMKERISDLEESFPKLATDVAVMTATLSSVIQQAVSNALHPVEERLRNIEIAVAKLQTTTESNHRSNGG